VNGNNVLDGSTGSNFLVGGTGNDTFFVDDRAAPADIWSTVAKFHSGDAATVFGVTQAGFNLSWVDGQGAAGFTGLTLVATAAGKPIASLTLAGFSSADLTNGRLAVSFGVESDGSGSFMFVHGN
jgi:Ca2+-binding RTX toxin-like protein